jgi:AcrR family transcriptional regulator
MDTCDRIIDAAHELVDAEGRGALSFRKVAKRAGVSVGTVQYYYASMEQLLDALTDPWHDGLDRLLRTAAADLPRADDPEERLLDLCIDLYRLAVEHRALLLARRLDTLQRGGLLARRRGAAQGWLDRGAVMAAQLVGGTPDRWRLTWQATEHLLVGFALDPPDMPEEQVEAFLRSAARALGRQGLGDEPEG